MKGRKSIESIDDLTTDEVVAIGKALEGDPVMTEVMGVAWAIGMVTGLPLLLDHAEFSPLLYERYKKLTIFPLPAGEG